VNGGSCLNKVAGGSGENSRFLSNGLRAKNLCREARNCEVEGIGEQIYVDKFSLSCDYSLGTLLYTNIQPRKAIIYAPRA